jgi:hypothetical protein
MSVSTGFEYGYLLPVEPFLRGQNLSGKPVENFTSYSLTLSRRTGGQQQWERAYALPHTGFGIKWFDFRAPRELGNPVAVYRYFRAPFFRRGSFSFDYQAEIGFAVGWQRFDYARNPYNDLISTRVVAYLHPGIGFLWQVADHWAIKLDAGLNHFSNGNFRQPNAGLNGVAGSLQLRYRFGQLPPPPPLAVPESAFIPQTVFTLAIYGGRERRLYYPEGLDPGQQYRGLDHGIMGITGGIHRRVSPKSMIGLGAALFYRAAGSVSVATKDGQLVRTDKGLNGRHLRVGILPSYELIFNRVSLMVQAEYYVYGRSRTVDIDRFHQKIGFKYRLGENLYVAALVNARQFTIADYMEWHLGYSWGR